MLYSHNDLLKLIHETKAVSIWDHTRGPVFWYAANVPGPFYVNTEMVIGNKLSEKLLTQITSIIASTADLEKRASLLNALILDAYKTNEPWQRLIATMVERGAQEFKSDSFSAISGGERRDWLFSIPFAQEVEMPHLFLFKNKGTYCDNALAAGQNVLHVSDLINNAASFLDLWQPALSDLKLGCVGNLCITVRGSNGVLRLKEAGQKVVCLIIIDETFFVHLLKANLIGSSTAEEISAFFRSAPDWASRYLIGKPDLFNVSQCDPKSFSRLCSFIEKDPWTLRPQHEDFFRKMQDAIRARQTQAA